MLKFKYVNFDQDIINLIIDENKNENTLFLFPTVTSRNLAIKRYQNQWQFSNSDFMTLEDWKYSLFHPKHRLLKEEKRSLAFFLSLDEENKKFFNITDYFSSIEIGNNFFSFWEEINEELVELNKISEAIEKKTTSGNWQINTFEQMLIIRENYQKFIAKLKFSDKIFSYKVDNYKVDNLLLNVEYDEIIVANQFYLTNLEKHLLKQMTNVTMYYQIPPQILDTENLTMDHTFSAEMLTNIRTKKITEIRTSDNFSMICSLFEQIQQNAPKAIIDFRFAKQSYSSFFSRDKFIANSSKSFTITSVYKFFYNIRKILENIIYRNNLHLIPLHIFLEAIIADDFIKYFCDDAEHTKEDITNYLYYLIEFDYQYIDLELKFLDVSKLEKESVTVLDKIMQFIVKAHNLKSMVDFNSFIANFHLENIITGTEADYSNLKEIFAQIKSDFAILDKLGIVDNWQKIFNHKKFAANVMKLFLDYMKAKTLRENLSEKRRLGITSLQDTRNLQYPKVFVLNVTEGILPPKRKVPFLLSENQRKILGLKTFEDIRLREKYYFYRLVAQSQEIVLFSNENEDENKEVSSFAEELRLHFDDIYKLINKLKFSFHNVYETYLGNNQLKVPKITNIEQFHKINFEQNYDIPDKKINLSFYKWRDLKENPFIYYMHHQMQIKERPKEIKPDFSSKFMGNLTHEIFTLIWQRIIELYQGNKIHHNFLNTNQNYVDDALKHIFSQNKEMIYKIPYNYSTKYFNHIFLPILKKGIMGFFSFLHNNLDLSDKYITIFPETNKTSNCFLGKVNDFTVYLRGKADMRIESDKQKYIFDYKTGSNSSSKKKSFEEQLLMYEQIYYLAHKEELSQAVKSYLYFVEKQENHEIKYTKKKPKEQVIEEFKQQILQVIENMTTNGFVLGEKTLKYEPLDITRRDLKRK